MHAVVGVLFWLLFAFSFFMMVNQLLYQENSMLFNWSQEAPGYWVLAIMVTMGLFSTVVAFLCYHMYRDAGAWFCIALMWAIFFLGYNHVIWTDVQNKITAGDFPDPSVPVTMLVPESASAKVKDWANQPEVLKTISDAGRDNPLDFPDIYPTA